MSQVYAGGPTSGGHYNPAVTVGAFVRFRMDNDKASLPAVRVAGYIVIQSAAALIAGAVALVMIGKDNQEADDTIGAPYPSVEVQLKAGGWAIAVIVEALGTFALVLVVLNVATSKDVEKNSYFGLAIGFTVQAMAYGVGSISGGAFNPAVGLLQLINQSQGLTHEMVSMLWIFWVGPFVGGILAALFFQLQSAGLTKVQGPFLETKEGLVSP